MINHFADRCHRVVIVDERCSTSFNPRGAQHTISIAANHHDGYGLTGGPEAGVANEFVVARHLGINNDDLRVGECGLEMGFGPANVGPQMRTHHERGVEKLGEERSSTDNCGIRASGTTTVRTGGVVEGEHESVIDIDDADL